MKTLYIVRHAKSSWRDLDLSDFDRPLKGRGVKDAYRVGERLKEREIIPDLIFTSNAIRALHTAIILARCIDFPLQRIMIREQIYHSDKDILFGLISEVSEQYDTLMLVGHDPTVTHFINHFLNDRKLDKIPTSSVIEIKFMAESWKVLKKSSGKTITQILPKTMETLKLK